MKPVTTYTPPKEITEYKNPAEKAQAWIEALGGANRVSKILGVSRATVFNWRENPTPLFLAYIDLSERNCKLVNELARLKRRNA